MKPAFIEQLTLTNFKCYTSLTLSLKPGINLIYGLNGSGKTTVLEALSVAAGSLFMEFPKGHNVEQRVIRETEVRLEPKDRMRYPEPQFPVSIVAKGTVLGQKSEWSRPLNSFEGGTLRKEAESIAAISREALAIAQNGRKDLLPIIAYFSTNRLFTSRKETEKQPIGRFLGYFNSLNESNIRKQIRSWFKDAEYEQYQRQRSEPEYIDQGLEGLKTLILSVFQEDWKDLYYFEPATDSRLSTGLFIVQHDGTILPEAMLSDGYRNFLWLFLEIAWRCYMLNPYLGENAAKETNGIVLIDEVDLHLHPKWQQMVVGILAEAFPNIQFALTTHSPNVLASVKADQVILLTESGALSLEAGLYGSDPNYVQEAFMQVGKRTPALREPIQRYFELLNNGKGKTAVAKALRTELEQKMDKHDPLFYEADTLISFLSDDETEV